MIGRLPVLLACGALLVAGCILNREGGLDDTPGSGGDPVGGGGAGGTGGAGGAGGAGGTGSTGGTGGG
ncbi:MAG TPA: hypothetical protein ENK57_21170, partial [Polyangiaceae bacterium]|nr:hypothetical protein [Polyangiaceae bacterium]